MKKRTLLQIAMLYFLGALMVAACLFSAQYGCDKIMPVDPDRAVVR